MPTIAGSQLAPPKSWDEFEEMCADLFSVEWGDRNLTRHGAQGQVQHGVDIYGRLPTGGYVGVQCKGKRRWPPTRLTTAEIDADVKAALQFRPPLTEYTIATTAMDDNTLQAHARAITDQHERAGLFKVYVIGWGEISRRLTTHPELVKKYYEYLCLTTVRDEFVEATERIPERVAVAITKSFSDGASVAFADRYVEESLTLVLKQRGVDSDSARNKLRDFATQAASGELRWASPRIRRQVLYWAARLFAAELSVAEEGRRYLARLIELDPTADVRIIDAYLKSAEGKGDEALHLARDIDSSDGRTALFSLLHRHQGREGALRWLDSQKRDDPDLLNGVGWRNAAIQLAEAGRWEEAAERLCALTERQRDQCPDLAYVEGAMNAGLLLPDDFRRFALTMNVFHPEVQPAAGEHANRRRLRAKQCFECAADLMERIHLPARAEGARLWLLWLRLTDPDASVAKAARDEIGDWMRDGRRAVEMIPVARAFSIQFDPEPLASYLAQRERLGGLDDRELGAKLYLVEKTQPAKGFAEFLEREERRLRKVIPLDILTGWRIEMLLKDGQVAKAESLLKARVETFSEHDSSRLTVMVAKHKGEDVREQLDALYKRTGDLIDLKNLVHHLFCVRDWTSLRPLLEELFRREPTIENARRVVACLYHRRDVEAAEIVAFLQQNADLVQRDDDLTSTKAWALFYEGRLQEAREVQKELVKRRRHVNDLSLDINLTIQSGDWDGFAVIVDQEWPGRDTLDPKLLLRLGALAGEVGQRDRAITFATLAVEKAPNDPHILVGAYALAVDLGREGVSEIDWLARAAELSSEAGPVRKVDLRLVMEDMLPAATERSRKVDRKLTEGEIPIHLAASLLKTPMSRAFFELPHLNEIERDARRLTLIPIVSGARGRVEAKQEWTIGLDITSVFVLFGLGLLEKAFGAFRRVLLPTATMELLLNERRLARFHQPSRIAAAEQVRAFIDAGRLKVLSQPPAAPQRLVEEVGRDLAELLETARRDGGRVVRPQPIHRPGTYLEKESDLGDEARRFVSTVALARALMEAGHLERERYERAVRYLGKVDLSPEQPSDPTLLNQPLYIDDLALIHLQTAGLFEVVCTSAGQVSVHPSFQEEIVALISARRQGERLAQKLDDLRAALRDSVADGRVGFLPWRLRDDDETGDLLTEAPTLARLLQDFGPCDAICVDDRFANHTMTIADQKGRTLPLLCVLDILHHMATTGVINRQAHLTALHTLRRKGFILIPIEPDELEERLRDSSYDPSTKQLSERIELRTLRQSLAKVRSLALIRQPRETLFLDRLRISSVVTLYRLWQDPVLLTDRVEALTDWVWNHLAPSPLNWAHTIEDSDKVMAPEEAFALHLSMLLQLLWGLKRERSEALCKWIESQVLGPLLPTNPVLLDRVTDRIKWEIDRLVEESSHDTA